MFHFKYSNVFIFYLAILLLFIYLLFFVVVSRIGHKSTTKCIIKYSVSYTGFCLCLQVKPSQLGPVDSDGYVHRHNV
jgi:hypothetical protein